MRCGGIFSKCFAANLLENPVVKFFENWLRTNRVATMSLVSPVLANAVLVQCEDAENHGMDWRSDCAVWRARLMYVRYARFIDSAFTMHR